MTIAEIIAEAKRLEAEYDTAVSVEHDSEAHALWNEKCAFWDEHGPLLVAVAEAAVEMREAERVGYDTAETPYAHGPRAVHKYGCPLTRIGKKYGPCRCGGADIQARIEASRAAFDAALRGEGQKP